MLVAVPTWRDRVSPVFDVAQHLLLVELADMVEVSRQEVWLHEAEAAQRVCRLEDLHVRTLICGAISQSLKAAVDSSGVDMIDQVCGDAEEVLLAYRQGRLHEARFAMPGSAGHQRPNVVQR